MVRTKVAPSLPCHPCCSSCLAIFNVAEFLEQTTFTGFKVCLQSQSSCLFSAFTVKAGKQSIAQTRNDRVNRFLITFIFVELEIIYNANANILMILKNSIMLENNRVSENYSYSALVVNPFRIFHPFEDRHHPFFSWLRQNKTMISLRINMQFGRHIVLS
jgi:hypothetical protein